MNRPCCIVLLGIASLSAAAQNVRQPEPVQESQSKTTLKVYSRLVVLDVVVVDKHGVPVLDLKKEDFEVTEGKDEQRIRSLELPSAHSLPAGNLVHSSADLGKVGSSPVDILVLDELNTPFEDNAFSRFSAQKFLKAQPATMPPTTLLVATDRSFHMLQDYTQDRDILEAALKRDPAEYPWRLARNGNTSPEAVVRFGQTLDTLQQIAQAAAGTPGRKNIIWIGRGFPSIDLTGLDEAASKPVTDAIRRCTDLLMSSRVTLYVVDPTALSSATYDTETPNDLATIEDETGTEPFADAISFSMLAPATGGRVFSARNDVDREIADSIRDGANYYTLAYTPSAIAEPGDYRHVRVSVDRPGLTVMTRDGYYAQPQPGTPPADSDAAKAEKQEEVLDVASAALSKMVYTGVKLRGAKGSTGRYNLAIADSSVSWTPQDEGSSTANLEIVAVSFNAKEKVLSHVTVEKKLSSKQPNARAGEEEIVSLPLTLPSDAVRLRIVVRDAVTGRLGSADIAAP